MQSVKAEGKVILYFVFYGLGLTILDLIIYSLGLTNEQFWEYSARRYKEHFGLDLKVGGRKFLWEQAIDHVRFQFTKNGRIHLLPKLDEPNVHILTSSEDRLRFYTEGRPLKLNDLQIQTLEILAKAGPSGITQSEVAKILSLDPRSFFHQLKSLIDWHIIVRLPVSYQRTFTYLLYLSRFAPDDEAVFSRPTDPHDESVSVLPSVIAIRNRIMDILQSAPQRTLPATEVYRLLGDMRHIRIYRRNINWLVCQGFLECFIAEELGGVAGKILRWKKPLTDVRINKKEPIIIDRPKLGFVVRGITLERQVHDYIDQSGPKGVTLSDVMWDFGVTRKLAYRLGERLTNPKIHPSSDVVKAPEFHGKERRHRFFTKTGQMRSITSAEELDDVILLGSSARDSVTRTKRLKALLDIVNEEVVVESGKPLASNLQRRLAETSHTMDTKTLKRLIEHLESQGQLRVIIIALAGVNKTVLMRADLTPDDPNVVGYIENMKRNRADVAAPPNSQSLELSTSREHKYHMQKYGYVFGVLARCRLLHTFLLQSVIFPQGDLERGDRWLCETLPAFFRILPLDLFLRIVGVGEMSSTMRTFLSDPGNRTLSLEELSAEIKEEIHRRRVDRHKTVIKRLMEMLAQLGLAAPDNRYPSVAFRLPFQFRLSRMAGILDKSGRVVRTVDFTTPGAINEYWDWLASLAEADATESMNNLSDIYLLAMQKESWQAVSPFSRSFRKGLRRIVSLSSSITSAELDIELGKLAEDFEIDRESVLRAYSELADEVERDRNRRIEERRARREKRSHTSRRIQPRESDPEHPMEAEETGPHRKAVLQTFSPSELEAIRVAFFCLQLSQFRSVAGTLQWTLVENLYQRGIITGMRASEELRCMVQRFLNSWEQSRRMRRVEHQFRTIEALCAIGAIDDIPQMTQDGNIEEYFEMVYMYYQQLIAKLPEIQKRVRHQQNQIRSLKEISDVTFLDCTPSIFDPELNWKRMSRAQQQRYFSRVPSFFIPAGGDHSPKSPIYSPEWIAIEKTFAMPVSEYDAHQAKEYLQNFDQGRIDGALEQMITSGLVSRGESNRFKPRIPGSEYHVHEKFIALVDSDGTWVEGEGFRETLRGVVRGQISLSYEVPRGSTASRAVITQLYRGASLSDRISTSIERYMRGNSNVDALWFDLHGRPKANILMAACRIVNDEITTRPGISLQNLNSACWPFLTNTEVSDCIGILLQARFIDVESASQSNLTNQPHFISQPHFYPSLT
jgi:hypothetical protein